MANFQNLMFVRIVVSLFSLTARTVKLLPPMLIKQQSWLNAAFVKAKFLVKLYPALIADILSKHPHGGIYL